MGPAAQSPGREPAKGLTVSSGPVVLSVRPLSPYQLTLLDTAAKLRSNGRNDRQIAVHFNLIGWLRREVTDGSLRVFFRCGRSMRSG